MTKRKPKSTQVKLLLLLGSALLGVLGLEALLRLRPQLLPMGLRAEYPLRGIEFLRPGILSEMPVDELWPPLVSAPGRGIPPADLKQYGIAPRDEDSDARRYPNSLTPIDRNGLPNSELPASAEVVLVGDSLLLAASSEQPAGLARELERQTGWSTYSLGVPGIGPQHEASLLERVGLPLEPKLVLWFFFGGNDLNDAKQVQLQLAAGKQVHADLDGYRATPSSYLMSLVAWTLRGPGEAAAELPPALPPLRLEGSQAGALNLWLHPSYLARTALTRAQWEAHVAWEASLQAIERSRAQAEQEGARFVLVYVPSKSEALLPALAEQGELLLRTLNYRLEEPLPLDAEQAVGRMLAHRGALAEALGAHCERVGIPFFSATGVLERQALAGEAGYLATDTHWTPAGQAPVLEALLSFLKSKGLAVR